MNTVVTSKAEILEAARELIREQGLSAVSIRSVAAACGVSVGSIYNYFDSKTSLVGAAVESVWLEIFHREDDDAAFRDTLSCISWMYGRMEEGSRRYPGFFTLHALGFVQEGREDGKRRMLQVWEHIEEELCAVIGRDPNIRSEAFTEQLTLERFADILLSLMLSAILRSDFAPDTVMEVARRCLY